MPMYDYLCGECGQAFAELRPMAAHREPHPCPACGVPAPRVPGASRLSTMPEALRLAHQTNERSSHEPRVRERHQCGPGCSHGASGTKRPLQTARARSRPWMLGH